MKTTGRFYSLDNDRLFSDRWIPSVVITLLLSLALASPSVPADLNDGCLSVTKSEYTKGREEHGITEVRWESALTNKCTVGYDADLVIELVNSNGKVLYQARDLIAVERSGSRMIDRVFHVPNSDYEALEEIVVKITAERERPF